MLSVKFKNSFRLLLYLLFTTAFASVCYVQAANQPKPLIDVQEDEDGYYYTVKKGDTLWGLSRKFFNSSWLWPDLWGKNRQLPNPHWIYPGQRIRLVPKPPKPAIVPTEEPLPVVSAEQEIEEPPYFIFGSIDQIGFIRKEELTPTGYILGERSEEQFIDQGDVVYIKQTGDHRSRPGHLYTVYRPLEKVINPAQKNMPVINLFTRNRNNLGIQYLILGQVQIIKNDDGYDVGRIIRSYRRIHADDLLMPYQRRSPKITLCESQPGIDGQIIGTEDNNRLFASDFIVFINKGRVDGIKPGQEYSIYELKTPHKVDIKNDFGSLLVLHVEEAASTALVTFSRQSMQAGERFRTPVSVKD